MGHLSPQPWSRTHPTPLPLLWQHTDTCRKTCPGLQVARRLAPLLRPVPVGKHRNTGKGGNGCEEPTSQLHISANRKVIEKIGDFLEGKLGGVDMNRGLGQALTSGGLFLCTSCPRRTRWFQPSPRLCCPADGAALASFVTAGRPVSPEKPRGVRASLASAALASFHIPQPR
jgi:hypothetical protein